MSVQALSQFREFAAEFTHAALSLICEVRFRAIVDSFFLWRDCAGSGGSEWCLLGQITPATPVAPRLLPAIPHAAHSQRGRCLRSVVVRYDRGRVNRMIC